MFLAIMLLCSSYFIHQALILLRKNGCIELSWQDFYCMDGNTRNIHKYTLYTRLQHFPQPSALKRIFHAYSTLVAWIEAIKREKHDSAFLLILFYRLFAPHMGRFFLYSHLIYSSYYIEFSLVALAAALWP